MKKEMSSLDLHYLLRELNFLKDSRVDKITNPSKNTVKIDFYVSSKGKHSLKIIAPFFIYLTESKDIRTKAEISGFCVVLRKHLNNARLKDIAQFDSERIIEFVLESRDNRYFLIMELFGRGNIVLCDRDKKIITALSTKKMKNRTIRGGIKYTFPKKEYNFLKLKLSDLKKAVSKSKKENISRILAVDLGLGGVYSQEVCLLAGIDKNKKAGELSDKSLKLIFSFLTRITNKKISPLVVFEGESKAIVKDIVPFGLELYNGFPNKKYESFNKALDSVLSKELILAEKTKAIKKYEGRLDKLKKIIKKQDKRLAGLLTSEEENQKKGEVIYENYKLVEEILSEIKKARKKYSWKEIKQKLKGHKIIKNINEKTGEIMIEV